MAHRRWFGRSADRPVPDSQAPADEFRIADADWDARCLEAVDTCPVCGSDRRVVLYEGLRDYVVGAPGRWTLRQCSVCQSGYLDPRPTSDSVGLAYSRYYTHSTEVVTLGRIARIRRRLSYGYLNRHFGYGLEPAWAAGAWVVPHLPPDHSRAGRVIRYIPKGPGGTRLFDVGSGNGAYLSMMQWQGWDVLGIDFDPAAVTEAQDRKVTVMTGTDERMDELTPGSFDAVTINHALEHSPNPLAMLRRAHALLRDGGLLWVATPNLDSNGHQRFGKNWRGLEPPRHFVLFTRSSLERALLDVGFDVVERPPAGWDEAWYYRECRQIEHRSGSAQRQTHLPLSVEALAANWTNWRRPAGSEEAALVARRRPA